MDIAERGKEKDRIRFIWPLLVLMAGIIGYSTLLYLKKSPPRAPAQSQFTPVQTQIITPTQQRSILSGFGTIQASKQVDLRPLVSGTIIALHEGLVPGKEFPVDTMLVQIDPRDYDVQVSIQQAELARAQAALLKEQGMQIVAEKEWNMVKGNIRTNPLQQELALRKPQLKEMQALLKAAESNLAKATLDLARTKVESPFKSLIIERQVSIGDYVTPQSSIARIASTEEYWVYVSVPHEQLRYLPDNDTIPATVSIRSGDTKVRQYSAYVKSTLGNLTKEGRMAQILVAIPNPREQHPQFPLLLGAYGGVQIEGVAYKDVFAVPNEALRAQNRLWVYSNTNTLTLIETEPLFVRDGFTYIRVPGNPSLEIIVSDISHPLEGLPLIRLQDLVRSNDSKPSSNK